MNKAAEWFLYYCLALNLIRFIFRFGRSVYGEYPYVVKHGRADYGIKAAVAIGYCAWIAMALGWL